MIQHHLEFSKTPHFYPLQGAYWFLNVDFCRYLVSMLDPCFMSSAHAKDLLEEDVERNKEQACVAQLLVWLLVCRLSLHIPSKPRAFRVYFDFFNLILIENS